MSNSDLNPYSAVDIQQDPAAFGYEEPLGKTIYATLAQWFFPIYRRLYAGRAASVDKLERKLHAANITMSAEIYLAGALGIGTIIGTFFGLLTGISVYSILESTGTVLPSVPLSWIPFSDARMVSIVLGIWNAIRIMVISAIVGAIGGLLGLIGGLSVARRIPEGIASKRRDEIEVLLPDVISFMFSLSANGTNRLELFGAVAEAEEQYGEAAVEFQRIVSAAQYSELDYVTALEDIAAKTPSPRLSQFLTDFLTVLNSGGDLKSFLASQKDGALDDAEARHLEAIGKLEVMGEFYAAVSIFPILGIAFASVVGMFSNGNAIQPLLFLIAYPGSILMGGGYFMILAWIKPEDYGGGRLDFDGINPDAMTDTTRHLDTSDDATGSITDIGLADRFADADTTDPSLFKRIRNRELRHRINNAFTDPFRFFRRKPSYILAFTLPATIIYWILLLAMGMLPTSGYEFLQDSTLYTIWWVLIPVFGSLIPLTFFYEWHRYTLGSITDTLTDDLRKIANANDAGATLVESIKYASGGANNDINHRRRTRFADELLAAYNKVKFGTPLSRALVELNNRYEKPRLARTIKLIQRAQESSSEITEVLLTAAGISDRRDRLEKEQASAVGKQILVLGFVFFLFLGVIYLFQEHLIKTLQESMASTSGASANVMSNGGGTVDPAFVEVVFFHTALIQAFFTGINSGYMRDSNVWSGFKYATAYLGVTTIAFLLINVIF